MYKGKLYLLLSALSLGKEIRVDRETVSIETLFKELQDLAHQLPKQIAMGPLPIDRKKPIVDRNSELNQ